MTQKQTETRLGFKQWLDMGDIFYTKRDKLNFLSALNAVVNEKLGLVMVSKTPTLLNYYSRMLIARLRKVTGINVEVFLPTTTDGLLKKFNDILADMSLEQAKKPPVDNTSFNVMVVHDANIVAHEQWVLLTRLMADFPGVNLRLVLFLDEHLVGEHDSLISLLGKELHRWSASPPTFEEAQELMQVGKENGYFSEVQALLNNIDIKKVPTNKTAEHDVNSIDEVTQRLPLQSDGLIAENVTQVLPEDSDIKSKSRSKRIVTWAVLLSGSALLAAWFMVQVFGREIISSVL